MSASPTFSNLCMHSCMYACMYVCICMIYACTCTCIYMYIHIHIHNIFTTHKHTYMSHIIESHIMNVRIRIERVCPAVSFWNLVSIDSWVTWFTPVCVCVCVCVCMMKCTARRRSRPPLPFRSHFLHPKPSLSLLTHVGAQVVVLSSHAAADGEAGLEGRDHAHWALGQHAHPV